MTSPRSSRKRPRLLAAPIVITASLGGACEYKTYTNPMPPQGTVDASAVASAEPSAAPSAASGAAVSAEPSPSPVASVSASANPTQTADPASLAAVPTERGTVQRNPDGSCMFVFAPPSKECPKPMRCNPGPPRMPIKVKCPPDAAGKP